MVIEKTKEAVKDIMSPFYRFFKIESSGGILLIIATAVALIWANTPFRDVYFHILEFPIAIGAGDFLLEKTLHHWINDGLMALFFFLVGLEIKREIMAGELSSFSKAILPIGAAVGGMVLPALIYIFLQGGTPAADGWGIPMATDIAFTIGILSLIGKRVPLALKVFLVAFAIVDDIGAVIVIALFYSHDIMWNLLFLSMGFMALLMIANMFHVRSLIWYVIIGHIIWFLFLKSGIHPTLAGIIVAFTIPANRKLRLEDFVGRIREQSNIFCKESCKDRMTLSNLQLETIDNLQQSISKVQSPLQSLEHLLHPFVTYVVMPLFALANAGVVLTTGSVSIFSGVSLSIAISLIAGKVIGISGFTWLMVKLKIGKLPSKVNMKMIFGAAMLGAVGFTMSLFISNLAFGDDALLNNAKIGILTGSFIAGVTGYLLLKKFTK
ncbi:MAG TPA: Na+/H+ antiporter NhaA [Salinivirga sp.]|uniref:Na+/H+ antiporter NhaA n=1 Tax=Salinivirga sp. TaxID=1970192 RepID=UPI002B474917|nr:Na+/H+ antiporter NhaA [Salinivirga sp.]HKK59001.1 Na+/H+ antiporter NhaA [Salinivirga sp.]